MAMQVDKKFSLLMCWLDGVGVVSEIQRFFAGAVICGALSVLLAILSGHNADLVYRLAVVATFLFAATYERNKFKLHGAFANIFDTTVWTFGATIGALAAWMFHHVK